MDNYVTRQIGFMKEHGGIGDNDKKMGEIHKGSDVDRQTTKDLISEWNRLKTMDTMESIQNNQNNQIQNQHQLELEQKQGQHTMNMDKMIEAEEYDHDERDNDDIHCEVIVDGKIKPDFEFKGHTMHPQMEKYINREFGMIIDNGGVKEKYNYLYVNKEDEKQEREINEEDEEKMDIYETSPL